MKKVLLALAVVAMAASFSSCKKDCKCTTYTNGVEVGSVTEKTKNCSDLESKTEMMGVTTEVKCEAE